MRLLKNIKNTFSGLYLSLKRFPVTILFSASVATTLIAISELHPKDNTLGRIAMILALGIPLSLCIKLFFERRDEKNPRSFIAVYLSGAISLFLYYFLFLKTMTMVPITRYIAVSLAFYLIFLVTPYFLKREQFEMYVITIFTSFFITIIYSIVLYFGLSAILFTIDKLLGIKILVKFYYYAWILVVFIFALSYFLSGVPLRHQELTPNSYPKLLRILLLYIVMPLITAYTLILYIYFGKILVTTQWPVGLVSHLVLWYSIIVTIVLFFITPIKDEHSWQNKFLKFFPKIMLPLIIMMFISIGIRIKAYGVTENRYFVVILGLWIFFVMIYFSLVKNLRNIIIPITLSIVAIISVFGPLSCYSISKMSQNNRFEKILTRNNMLKDGKIQSSSNISKEDQSQISSILDYFNNNHSFKDVKYLPENFKLDNMNTLFGFSFVPQHYIGPDGYFNFTRNQSENPIDIKGYDYLIDMRNLKVSNNESTGPLNVSYNFESAVIKIKYNGIEVYTKDLNSFVKNISDKHAVPSTENSLPPEEMTLVEETEKIKVKFVFLNISGSKNQSTGTIEANGIDFYILVKIK